MRFSLLKWYVYYQLRSVRQLRHLSFSGSHVREAGVLTANNRNRAWGSRQPTETTTRVRLSVSVEHTHTPANITSGRVVRVSVQTRTSSVTANCTRSTCSTACSARGWSTPRRSPTLRTCARLEIAWRSNSGPDSTRRAAAHVPRARPSARAAHSTRR